MKRLFYGGVFLVLVVALIAWRQGHFGSGERRDGASYRLAKVTTGNIMMAVSTTGKVTPVTTVEVGSQISGQISEMLADFNSNVLAGQIIARLDPASFATRVQAADAELAVARANVAVQMAALEELKADAEGAVAALRDADQELQRVMSLYDKKVVAQSNVDRVLSNRDQARARYNAVLAREKKQQAQLQNTQAVVLVRQATLKDRQLDLDRTNIRSPIDGVVTGRNVDQGQTVAASLQAPVLFSIAGDLSQMQVEVSVDEADIGRVLDGQKVVFTVDAFSQRKFSGAVQQVRKSPTEVANVVTYTVIVGAANPDQALLPGMTANVEIIVGEKKQVLRVPEAALRFRPPGEKARSSGGGPSGGPEAVRARAIALIKHLSKQLALTAEQRSAVGGVFRETGLSIRGLRQGGMSPDEIPEAIRNLRSQSRRRIAALLNEDQAAKYRLILAEAAASNRRKATVWLSGENGDPQAINIVAGLSDGSHAEVIRGDLTEGAEVIVGIAVRKK
ncbi:MAG: HlyD family efflux transporter periplasmic adaptor subunit [Alphaproteobacteria bacterium]|jgi:HlyD family secretion protein|nr:HlyD family efflux transporter periplasmic adaptor subunit [Alphaproteobacteria bacterium]MBT5160306.1 HlyD family efflux transporter periplasmic adaptor subunit [Alphaproteobacteria bacterium]MBT5917491.1 HlyD family efflux transporter periplasmic adaptor subunit [Alphaproteobacteria bacterium]MBT6387225.1 HlyD family efflux transporter periplasmic adaptor subunit [Alphaproteobacteria bacterium]